MRVLTFLGYSAAEYENENKAAMLEEATRILDEFDPRATIVNIGAPPEGMGAVYETSYWRSSSVFSGSSWEDVGAPYSQLLSQRRPRCTWLSLPR
jgi:hypothetical protein